MYRSHARSAFTLVELLVVVAIIGVIIGIALPVISAVRRQVQETVCLSNLRSLGQAHWAYLSDNQDEFPTERAYGGSDRIWTCNLAGFKGTRRNRRIRPRPIGC